MKKFIIYLIGLLFMCLGITFMTIPIVRKGYDWIDLILNVLAAIFLATPALKYWVRNLENWLHFHKWNWTDSKMTYSPTENSTTTIYKCPCGKSKTITKNWK